MDLVQTADGYLWVATLEGLVRFDGARFVVFDRRTNPELASVRIHDLEPDRDGYLWLGTENTGVVRFDGTSFVRLPDPDKLQAESAARTLLHDSRGDLWIGTPQSLLRVPAGGSAPEQVLFPASVWHVFEDGAGTIWVGTQDGLFRVEGDRLRPVPLPPSLPSKAVRVFAPAGDDTLWVGTDAGVVSLRLDTPEKISIKPHLAGFQVVELLHDRGGTLWIGTEGQGLLRLRSGGVEPVSEPLGMPTAFVLSLHEDHEGSLWVGTDGGGLTQVKEGKVGVLSTAQGLSSDFILSVLEDRAGDLWVGTYGAGLNRVRNGRVQVIGKAEGLPGPFVWSLLEDRAGWLWVGTYQGLARLRDGVVSPLPPDRNLDWGFVTALLEDSDGVLWAGTHAGLYRFTQGRPVVYRSELPDPAVLALLEDRAGTVWVGTRRGLCRISDGRIRLVAGAGLHTAAVRALYQDGDGVLWIGTEGDGLFLWHDGRIWRVSTDQGLYDNLISQILEDDLGHLWMSCNRGLFRVSRQDLLVAAIEGAPAVRCQVLDTTDGMPSRECNGGSQPAGWRTRSGTLLFPTVKGLVEVDPARLSRNLVPPPVRIEQAIVDGRPWVAGTPLDLPPGTRSLQIDYTALSFMAPERVRFRVQLDGFDRDWVDAGSTRTALYTNLPPGSFTFRVRAANNDGVWSPEDATVELRQLPWFYQTLLFRGAVAAGLLLGFVIVYRLRVRGLEHRAAGLERLVQERTHHLEEERRKTVAQAARLAELDELKSRFFANISHEFRTPLTLIIGPVERALEGGYGEIDQELGRQMTLVLASARRLERLIGQLLSLARLEAGKMELEARRTDMARLLSGQVAAFASLAASRGIHLELAQLEGTMEMWIDPERMEQVISNLISNALKFTPAGGQVRVSAAIEGGSEHEPMVRIDVTDTGCGIPHGQQSRLFDRFFRVAGSPSDPGGTGIGLALARELVTLHGGELTVSSTEGVGSTFSVCIPVGHGPPGVTVADTPDGALSASTRLEVAVLGETCQAEDEADAAAAEPVKGDRRPLVLVVDDHAGLRELVAECLADDFRVAAARDGRAGLGKVERLGPDLVISDVMMPRMDGIELCRTIKGRDELSHIPVILLTARAGLEDRLRGLEHGADDYLPKPFDRNELRTRASNLVEQRRRLRERYQSLGTSRISDISATPLDEAFLTRALEVVERRLGDPDLTVVSLADELAMSPRHLQRKLKALTGDGPRGFVRTARLQHAADLLSTGAGNVTEIALRVGFPDPGTFSKAFHRQFGKPPSELLRRDPAPD